MMILTAWVKRGLCLVVGCLLLGACASQPPVTQPVKSPNDENTYRYLTLDNGLRVLLVSDPDTDKAAASLDVNVGAGDSPEDREGLPHFLEHMLFLGTEKYPDPSEYERYVSEHGGSRNAYTSYAHTNYFFDIDHNHLEPALDRFAQFFTAPLFDEAYVEREKHAVDSEYQMGIKGDARRNLDVFRELFNPAHPMTRFSVGNLATLADRDGATVRDDLLSFYAQYYSANIMALSVIGRESLDALEAMVRERFSAVPDRDVVLEEIEHSLFTPGTLPLRVAIEPEADVRQLQVFYPIPDYREAYRSKPETYLGSILGHEGEGSLLSILKADGLADSLGAGAGLSYRGGALMSISIGLTQRGFEQRDLVLSKLFQAIELVRAEGPNKDLYEEQGHLGAQAFRFREQVAPAGYARGLSSSMQYYQAGDVLRGDYIMDDYRPDLLAELLDHMRPGNVFVVDVAKGLQTDRNSSFYNTPYRVQSIDADSLATWASAEPDARLTMPALNEFIASDLELRPRTDADASTPELLVDDPALDIWFQQDDVFQVPRGGIYVNLRTPTAAGSARTQILSQLYVRLVSDAVNEFVYPAALAGVNFALSSHVRGFSFSVGGYNDKQLILLERILAMIESAEFNRERFPDIKERLLRDLANSKKARPYTQLLDDSRELFQHNEWDELEFAAVAADLSLADVEQFHRDFWADANAEALVYGNYGVGDVARLRELLSSLLSPAATEPVAGMKVMKLSAGQKFVYRDPVDHEDAVLMHYFQGGANNWRERAMAAMTGQIVQSDFFEEVRTEKQRGYIVFATAYPMREVPGTVFIVQSASTDPVQLQADVGEFIAGMAAAGRVTEEVFARHRDALILDLEQAPKNLFEQAGRYWRDLTRKRYQYDSREQLIAAVNSITLDDWLQHFRDAHIENPRSVLIYTAGRFDDEDIESRLAEGREIIGDTEALKQRLPSYQLH